MESLSAIAYNHILERIISFDYKPNDAVVENDICEELGISRTPLREALRRMEAEGFVTKVRNRGTFVRAFSQDDIIESCDIRKLFELYSLKNCIQEVTPEEVEKVKAMQQTLTVTTPFKEYHESDIALHDMITKYCMNTKMLSILKSLEVQMSAVQKISAQNPKRLSQSRDEHLQIIDAIEKKDCERANQVLEEHLENVKESFIQMFQQIRIEKL